MRCALWQAQESVIAPYTSWLSSDRHTAHIIRDRVLRDRGRLARMRTGTSALPNCVGCIPCTLRYFAIDREM